MKLKELENVLYSNRDGVQFCVVYDITLNKDITDECSVEYAIREHGEMSIKHIQAYNNLLIITV